MTTALITGITGQDGQHLTAFLIGRGYRIVGIVRDATDWASRAFASEFPTVELVQGDLGDRASLFAAVEFAQPDEIYNLGGMSSVARSFDQPELTADITAIGPLRLLEAIRSVGNAESRFFQASSGEMFGEEGSIARIETDRMAPRSPYACSKVFAHNLVSTYRDAYGVFACSGILFNHEGERRSREFVTRKITSAVARISLGLDDELVLGRLDVSRDWGYAGDYVIAMWKMLQAQRPDDYVIATGETRSLQDFLECAFGSANIDNWERYVRLDPQFIRPIDTGVLSGNPAKAGRELGWHPTVPFDDIVARMVRHDLALEQAGIQI